VASIMRIDLNSELGEGFGRYDLGVDAEIMPLISSVNVACGFHAGDPQVMARTVALAKQHQVSLGAHPGFPDLQGFGRRRMDLSPDEIVNIILYQLGALAGFARAAGVRLVQVKPHGALYNLGSQDREAADAIARAVYAYDRELVLVGLAGSALAQAGEETGLRVAQEGFPDRRYLEEGQLLPRSQSGAVISDPKAVAANAVTLARDGITVRGERIRIDTLCLHGDNAAAVRNARAVRKALLGAGFEISPLSTSDIAP